MLDEWPGGRLRDWHVGWEEWYRASKLEGKGLDQVCWRVSNRGWGGACKMTRTDLDDIYMREREREMICVNRKICTYTICVVFVCLLVLFSKFFLFLFLFFSNQTGSHLLKIKPILECGRFI